MSTIRIATSFNIDIEFPAASFPRRLLAWCIDLVVLIIYIMAIRQLQENLPYSLQNSQYMDGIFILLYFVPFALYHLISEILMKGRSIGKMILRLRVVNTNGGRPSISQVIIRWLIRTSDIMMFVIMIRTMTVSPGENFLSESGVAFLLFVTDVILVNTTARSQRLGDLLARTMVIRTSQKAAISETIFQDVQESYVPSYPQVMRLSDRDVNALKNILVSSRKNNDLELAARATEKVCRHLDLPYPESPIDFIATLLKDYNYLTAH